jgi:uncharacterized protein (DUF2236 family)
LRTRTPAEPLFPSEADAAKLLVGPDSVSWQFASDVRLYAVMLYPLLLQVAHPTVAAGVDDYSDFERRPWDRLLRTLDYVNLLVYGGADAVRAGRRLRSLHKAFRGTRPDGQRYTALEPAAYAWVHATLLEAYVAGHAHFGRRMRPDQIERFYREYRGLGRLIGVRHQDLPSSWPEFRMYVEETVRTRLTRTGSVDRVLEAVRHAAAPPVRIPDRFWRMTRLPASRTLWLGGLGLMDPQLRRRLGVRWTPFDEAAFRALGASSRALDPLLPATLRVTGPGHLRWRRAEIAAGPLGGLQRPNNHLSFTSSG